MLRLFSCVCVLVALSVATAGQQQPTPPPQHINGKIVRVDPANNTVVIRISDANTIKDVKFDVLKTTKFWGTDSQLIDTGLYFGEFKEGTAVWFQRGVGDALNTITELRLHDPRLTTPPKK